MSTKTTGRDVYPTFDTLLKPVDIDQLLDRCAIGAEDLLMHQSSPSLKNIALLVFVAPFSPLTTLDVTYMRNTGVGIRGVAV